MIVPTSTIAVRKPSYNPTVSHKSIHWLWPAVVIASAAIYCVGPIWDFDLFWHLAIGKLILQSHKLLAYDPLTFTADHREWIQHEWLSQLCFAWIESIGGLLAIRILLSACITLLLIMLLIRFLQITQSPLTSFLLLVIAWLALQPNITPRPHIYGWLMLCSTVYWWTSSQRRWFVDSIVTLLLVILWVNLHSSALLALLIALVSTFEAFVIGHSDWRTWLRRTALAGAGLSISPVGWRLFSYARLTAQVNVHSVEWEPLFSASTWDTHPWLIIVWSLAIALTIYIGWMSITNRHLTFPGPIVSFSFLLLAFEYRRMIAFTFVPLIAVAPYLSGLSRLSKGVCLSLTLLAVTFVLFLNFRRPDAVTYKHNLLDGVYPEAAADFLAATRLQGRMLNPPEWGGYLSWRLFPQYKTFADGRWDLIGLTTLNDGISMLMHRNDMSLSQKYAIAFVIQRTDQFILAAPLSSNQWSLAWVDPVSVVLLRRTNEFNANQTAICEYRKMHLALNEHFRWPFTFPPQTNLPPIECSK